MDPEQIREELRLRRASIDRKLDVLAACAREAKQRTLRRAIPVAVVLVTALTGIWAWKRRSAAPRSRRSLKVARASAAFR